MHAQTLDTRLRPVARALRDALRPGPPPFPQDAPPDRTFAFRLAGLRLEVPRAVLGPDTWRALNDRTYERNELDLLPRLLRPDDTVLEVGAALGLVSARAAQLARRVVAVEANADLLPIARRTHALNGVEVELLHAVVGHTEGEADFHLHREFWASSTAARPDTRHLRLPGRALSALLAEIRPEVLIVDVEGGEVSFFEAEALPGLRQVVVELHRWATGLAGIARVFADLGAAGFAYDPELSAGQVVTFGRAEA
ncbi:FkbM family methyltransferase [Falsiroseomonas oryziterrae]|uniref:FkbM family methyltransferase n=1 Tax=Falsiroseomonas oryziterrae TaxID=2911368 RepID=UPI001F01B39B|nr:FkbM family methyltransferase [Roseomonas sp. NPKOSM-4]